METKIIDGKQIASDVRADVAKKVAELKEFLHKCIDDGSIDPSIGREMLLVDREYKEIYK